MVTATFDKTLASQDSAGISKPDKSLIAKLFAAFVAAREAEARRKIAAHMAELSDNHLVGLGLSASEIAELRNGGPVNVRISR